MEGEINKVFKQGNSLAVVIPRDITEKLQIKEGSYLRIYLGEEDRIIMEVV